VVLRSRFQNGTVVAWHGRGMALMLAVTWSMFATGGIVVVLSKYRIFVIFSSDLLTFRVFQYSETNVMRFLFNLLRIKGLYMFRTLLAHPQEAFHKRRLLYCVRVMSVGTPAAAN
jgi:hypothetical protein